MELGGGQVAVITGGASGIGFALAEQLGARGLRIVVADVRGEAARDACARLAGVDALPVETDVRDAASVERLAARTLEHFGRADLVCNNAGIAVPRLPSWEQPLEAWAWSLEVMLLGVVHGVRAFVPHLVAQGSGHVLNTASMAGLMALPLMAPYAAAKHAVVGLTETLAEELDGTGVGATVLCPGFVPTDLARSTRENRPAGSAMPLPDPGAEPPRGTGATAADVAREAIAGVEAGRLHVVSAAGNAQRARDRVERLLANLPD